MEEQKAKQVMRSPRERISQWPGMDAAFGKVQTAKYEFVFGDLNQPVTDIMWILGLKFIREMPAQWS